LNGEGVDGGEDRVDVQRPDRDTSPMEQRAVNHELVALAEPGWGLSMSASVSLRLITTMVFGQSRGTKRTQQRG
jgi:hypothetical protein